MARCAMSVVAAFWAQEACVSPATPASSAMDLVHTPHPLKGDKVTYSDAIARGACGARRDKPRSLASGREPWPRLQARWRADQVVQAL